MLAAGLAASIGVTTVIEKTTRPEADSVWSTSPPIPLELDPKYPGWKHIPTTTTWFDVDGVRKAHRDGKELRVGRSVTRLNDLFYTEAGPIRHFYRIFFVDCQEKSIEFIYWADYDDIHPKPVSEINHVPTLYYPKTTGSGALEIAAVCGVKSPPLFNPGPKFKT